MLFSIRTDITYVFYILSKWKKKNRYPSTKKVPLVTLLSFLKLSFKIIDVSLT